MGNSTGIIPIKAVEMLDVDDGVLITVNNENQDLTKDETNSFSTILAEKQNLIELGYHHVQVLREELNTLRTELDNVRHAAKIDLEVTRNAARIELEATQNAAKAELKRQQDAAQVELENVRHVGRTTLEVVWHEMQQLQCRIAYYEAQENRDMMV